MPPTSHSKANYFTIGFYNLENLFDTVNDPEKLDDDFTPQAERRWDKKRFDKKVKKLGSVISKIGYESVGYPPVLLGVAEVENTVALDGLILSKYLKEKNYNYVHFDSPDERGIDTALLYRADYFSVIAKQSFELHLENEHGGRDFTRNILYVFGTLQGEEVHILVNHWPSRRSGTEESNHKRIEAAKRNLEILHTIQYNNPEARIIIMGDFNDDPFSESINTLVNKQFYNPMELLLTREKGSLSYKKNWHLFDQIIISHNFLRGHDNPFQFKEAKIYNPLEVQEYKGKYKGLPFRTYAGKKYLGGFSDHFPVYAIFSIE